MAGHSKWANIKHRKSAQDAKRGRIFTKILKKVSSAARRGGGDPETNIELRLYLQKAKDANVPKENIERAILKATGQLEGVSYTDFTYEGYGPGGVAILLEGSTDNKNRTVADIRHAFSKYGGNLGQDGCVAWMFHTKGVLSLETDGVDPDAIMELALENGAEDFENEGGVITITTEADDYHGMRQALIDAGFTSFMEDEITMVAETQVEPEIDVVRTNMTLLEILEDYDDVENVYHNLDISDEVAETLGAE